MANHSQIPWQQQLKEHKQEEEKGNNYGVLLYYKYFTTPISDLQCLLNFYNSNCVSLSLLGRVRLSSTGVNVTVGGEMEALEKHIEAVKLNSLFEGTDFKLASCHQPLNDEVARECGFTSLSIRVVKELVTLSSHPLLKSPEISNAGRHLSAAEFHTVLQDAGKVQEKANSSSDKRLILLDARNLYETRVGKFQTVNVETVDPQIRQYSDLPSWIDDNSEQLRGNHILMYCTGGIRCEMASAYIRSKGAGFENVFQVSNGCVVRYHYIHVHVDPERTVVPGVKLLYGGIQRYLEQFPDGGFFKGKNFVFDHRVSVGSLDTDVLGTCLLCGCSYDDYSSRSRCKYCRMLVLVCDGCQKRSPYICELCQRNGKCAEAICEMEDDNSEMSEPQENKVVSTSSQTKIPSSLASLNGSRTSRKLRILCLHGFRQNASGFKGRSGSLAKKLKNLAELIFVDAPHELPFIYQRPLSEQNENAAPSLDVTPPKVCSKKFAWLVGPDYQGNSDAGWTMANVPFDFLQYQQQKEGCDGSLAYLKTVFSQAGPFDGILGFSQGAAMAALLSGQLGMLKGEINFRFVILCSGFSINMEEYQQGSINLPSLHIFGNDKGRDRQIANQASRELASLFEDGCSEIIEHDLGHIIPTQSPHIEKIKDFLRRFL